MAPSTPQSSFPPDIEHQNASYTRPQDPSSPTNLTHRITKRHQRLNVNPPPRLNPGGDTPIQTTASKAISSQLEAIEREARIQHTVMNDFASTVDRFVSTYKHDERKFAQDMCDDIVKFLTNSLFARSSNFVPIRVQSQPSSSTKSVSFAGLAKTLRNSGADFHSKQPRSSTPSGSRPTTISGGVSLSSTSPGSTNGSAGSVGAKKEDRRLLITIEPTALLNRPEPFALRQELATKIPGISLASVPLVTPTKTGWAITPADLSTRDLLQANAETILRTFHGITIKRPETWYNYAVPGVPSSFQRFEGGLDYTAELITDEVIAQTTETPVNCRPSRHGSNPETGLTTWIISFLAPVRSFRLFNTSETSKPIDKKPAIARHDPGCQGFCNPAKCTRYARCSCCGTRTDQHPGASGANCTAKARCANCHGPFPAGHGHCPAAPRRKDGRIIKPTKKELNKIRRQGDKEFGAPLASEALPQPQPIAQSQAVDTNSRKRKGSIAIAHEISSQLSSCSSEASSSPAPERTPVPVSSSRPRRATATSRNLNLASLSAQSLEPNDMDIDTIVAC
jgi:hypothetical protein